MNFVILAAGRSQRFGRNKLEERFNGKTLPRLGAEFALKNGASNIYLTLSRSSVTTDGKRIYHPILEDISEVCSPIIGFQSEEFYGPGAAISTWAGIINEPFVVLFGDNYYSGNLDKYIDVFQDETDNNTYFTTLSFPPNPRNLQLSAVVDGYVVEKPHSYMQGDYFCGMIRFPKNCFEYFENLKRSDRGEIEITDMINMSPSSVPINLKEIEMVWDDLTYQSDIERIHKLIVNER